MCDATENYASHHCWPDISCPIIFPCKLSPTKIFSGNSEKQTRFTWETTTLRINSMLSIFQRNVWSRWHDLKLFFYEKSYFSSFYSSNDTYRPQWNELFSQKSILLQFNLQSTQYNAKPFPLFVFLSIRPLFTFFRQNDPNFTVSRICQETFSVEKLRLDSRLWNEADTRDWLPKMQALF